MENMIKTYDRDLQEFTVNYYRHARECIKDLTDNAYGRRYYGEDNPVIRDGQTGYDLANNFHYLYSLLVEAYYKYAKNGMTATERAEFFEDYKIECIKKTFICNGCDISILIDEFTAIWTIPSDPPKNPVEHTGIGFDAIEDTFIIS